VWHPISSRNQGSRIGTLATLVGLAGRHHHFLCGFPWAYLKVLTTPSSAWQAELLGRGRGDWGELICVPPLPVQGVRVGLISHFARRPGLGRSRPGFSELKIQVSVAVVRIKHDDAVKLVGGQAAT
jgi:hypothetical protein